MVVLSGVVIAAALVLVVAGAAKIARPEGTVGAIRSAGLRVPSAAVTALGAAEITLGAVVVAWAPPVATVAMAATYAGFALFSVRLLTVRGAGASCGCFGQADSPVHGIHVAVNLAIAGTVAAATLGGRVSAVPEVPVLVAVASVVLAAALILALTLLPQLLIEARRVLSPADT